MQTVSPETVYEQLFDRVNGYGISALAKDKNDAFKNGDFTYGEVTPQAMRDVVSLLPQDTGGAFCDLGSGTGKAVIMAAMLGRFSRSIGIELIPELHDAAVAIGNRYEREYRNSVDAEPCELVYRNENILHSDLADVDVLFGHCITCFSDEMMAAFVRKCAETRPGTVIVSVSRDMNHDAFERVRVGRCAMGWGNATLYISRRK